MVELKTLKELRGYWMPNQVKARKFRMVLESNLKQEAIKWVKNYNIDLKLWSHESLTYKYIQGQIQTLTNFFNITEEDLNG